MNNVDYFISLANYAKGLLGRLPVERTPQPLDYAVGLLYDRIKEIQVE